MEISAVYNKDPIEFELGRRAYLKELKGSSSGDKGVSTSI